MQSIQDDMQAFRAQLEHGSLQKAYRALLSYMLSLRAHFIDLYPDYAVSGLYQGYLDMTYFALIPPSFKPRGLKIAIVFNYGAFRFEAWLAGRDRKVQREYWKRFKDSHWAEYRVVAPGRGIDSIVECDLVQDIDFERQDALTSSIESAAAAFIEEMERSLSKYQPGEQAGSPA